MVKLNKIIGEIRELNKKFGSIDLEKIEKMQISQKKIIQIVNYFITDSKNITLGFFDGSKITTPKEVFKVFNVGRGLPSLLNKENSIFLVQVEGGSCMVLPFQLRQSELDRIFSKDWEKLRTEKRELLKKYLKECWSDDQNISFEKLSENFKFDSLLFQEAITDLQSEGDKYVKI